MGFQLAPNGQPLAGFAIGTLGLATMTTLQLRALRKANSFSYTAILISCQPWQNLLGCSQNP